MDFTDSIVANIVADYRGGIGAPSIAQKYHSNYNTILRLLRSNGVVIRSFKMLRKTTVDHDYFGYVGHDQAYWLGFLYADGAVFPSGHQKSGKVSLVSKTSDMGYTLVEFKNSLQYSGDIKTFINKKNPFTLKPYAYGRLTIVSDRLVEDLCKLGCVPRKTFVLSAPPISSELCWDFIRGYLDGDGSITISRDPRGYARADFKFCGTEELLKWIDECFCKVLDQKPHALSKRWKNRNNNNWCLSLYVSQSKMRKLFALMDGRLWMPRKRQKVVEYLRWTPRI